jgi:hypothetical protein
MPKGPVRRAQLIAPFGVGAMTVARDGTSVITCGLDHWFKPEAATASGQECDLAEFQFREWRLEALLGVGHFRLPPDFRHRRRGVDVPNAGLTVPCLRFPAWHVCPGCGDLREMPSSARRLPKCSRCAERRLTRYYVQVPIVAMCAGGHIQDFPWREWVHRSAQPACDRRLSLRSTGGASLAAQQVSCECGAKRSLANVTVADANGEGTYLSQQLDREKVIFTCQGHRPWAGDTVGSCDHHLRGTLRSASNVYFAQVKSSIYLPTAGTEQANAAADLMLRPQFLYLFYMVILL